MTVNTPYDDVFRTLLCDCSSLVIPVVNEGNKGTTVSFSVPLGDRD